MAETNPATTAGKYCAFGLALLFLLLPLASCGKKGGLEPPAGEPNTYPRSYPNE